MSETEKEEKIITKEFFGIVFVAFSLCVLLLASVGGIILGGIGSAIQNALLGVFGYALYPCFIYIGYRGIRTAYRKKSKIALWKKCFAIVGCVFFITGLHALFTTDADSATLSAYASACYAAGKNGLSACTVGGSLFAVLAWVFVRFMNPAVGGILCLFLSALFFALPVASFLRNRKKAAAPAPKAEEEGSGYNNAANLLRPAAEEQPRLQPGAVVDPYAPMQESSAPTVIAVTPVTPDSATANPANANPAAPAQSAEPQAEPPQSANPAPATNRQSASAPSAGDLSAPQSPVAAEQNPSAQGKPYSEIYRNGVTERPKTMPPMIRTANDSNGNIAAGIAGRTDNPSFGGMPVKEGELPHGFYRHDFYSGRYTSGNDPTPSRTNASSSPVSNAPAPRSPAPVRPDRPADFAPQNPYAAADYSPKSPVYEKSDEPADFHDPYTAEIPQPPIPHMDYTAPHSFTDTADTGKGFGGQSLGTERYEQEMQPYEEEPPEKQAEDNFIRQPLHAEQMRIQGYRRPPLSLLSTYNSDGGISAAEIERNKQIIVNAFAGFHIQTNVLKVTVGPTVVRYDLDIPNDIRSQKLRTYSADLAMRLHAGGPVDIFVNFNSGCMSMDVPNRQRETVGLSSVLMTDKFLNDGEDELFFGIGKDIEGKAIIGNIAQMTHLLVAGATGAGKSVFLNSLIISLIAKYSPEDVRLMLIDPKLVEFGIYDKLPHLLLDEILSDTDKVLNGLDWVIGEMRRRNLVFSELTRQGRLVRNLSEYNKQLQPGEKKMPRIVVIVDELAELMETTKKEIEVRIKRLTALSRSAGIHLILATQRPSIDVITGVIKNNLPTRFAFCVTQEVDSRTILDEGGAEKLLGKGDMLYTTATSRQKTRVQGAFLTSDEVQRMVEYVRSNNPCSYDPDIKSFICSDRNNDPEVTVTESAEDEVDEKNIEALRCIILNGQASISMIQRRCSVGFNRAGKIVEWMEKMKYISAYDGAKPRKVLITREEFEEKYGPLE